MRSEKYYDQKDLYFSLLYGGAVYEETGETISDPLIGGTLHESGPVLRNVNTGARYSVRRLNSCTPELFFLYQNKILNPPDFRCIYWPKDIVSINVEQQSIINCNVERLYDDYEKKNTEYEIMSYGVLFDLDTVPIVINGSQLIDQLKHRDSLSWKNATARGMAVQLVSLFKQLNKDGYYYYDFSFDRFFFSYEHRALLDYSNLVFAEEELGSNTPKMYDALVQLDFGMFPIEFSHPAIVNGQVNKYTKKMQDYSLCAVLFFLFFGRFPYDGRLIASWPDRTIVEHYARFRVYHQNPIFIFDPEDQSNCLGSVDEETDQKVIDLWEESPPQLKKAFLLSLRFPDRNEGISPEEWAEIFKELGWTADLGEKK